MPSPSWSTLLDFLNQPAVAIRVAERDETVVVGPPGIEARGLSFRSEVERLAHIDSAIDELSPRGLDVGRDQVQSLICARRHLRDSRADLNRAFAPYAETGNPTSRILVLFAQGLGVRFAVRIKEFLSALLPRRSEFGRCNVPVRPAFLGNGP
jgi:hypothetical protein